MAGEEGGEGPGGGRMGGHSRRRAEEEVVKDHEHSYTDRAEEGVVQLLEELGKRLSNTIPVR